MGIPEGNSLKDQIVRRVSRVGETADGALLHDVLMEGQGAQHAVEQGDTGQGIVDGVKGRFLVFLHVLVVGKGDALHGGQEAHQGPVDPAGLAADQLADVGILLLGHDAGARRIGVIHLHEPVFIGIPQDHLLGEAGQVHHDQGQVRQEFDHVVPVGDRVHTVEGRSPETQLPGGELPVQGIGGAGQGARAQGAQVKPLPAVADPLHIPFEHLKIGAQMVGQGDRLGLLQMGEARHKGVRVFFHQPQDGPEKGEQFISDCLRLLADIHAHIQGHLVIAAPAGMELLAGLSDPFDQMGLHEAVDILIAVFKDQRAFFNIHQDPAQAAADPVRFLLADDPLPSQHGGVGYAAGDILIIKPAVKSQ